MMSCRNGRRLHGRPYPRALRPFAALTLLLLGLAAHAEAPTPAWPRWSEPLDLADTGVEWMAHPDGRILGVAARRMNPDAPARERRIEIVLTQVHRGGEMHVDPLLSYPAVGDTEVHRRLLYRQESRTYLALSLESAAAEGQAARRRGIAVYDLETLREGPERLAFNDPGASQALRGFAPVPEDFVERSWLIRSGSTSSSSTSSSGGAAAGDGPALLYASGAAVFRHSLSDPDAAPVELIRRDARIAGLAPVSGDPTLLVWHETRRRRRSLVLGRVRGREIEVLQRREAGLAELFSPGTEDPRLLGPRTDMAARQHLAAHRAGNRIFVVAREIDRERSSLSDFYTGLRLQILDLRDSSRSTGRWLVAPASGVLFSGMTLRGTGADDIVLSFLYERTGGSVEADLYHWSASADQPARNISRTPRRVLAPFFTIPDHHEIDADEQLSTLLPHFVWLQEQPEGHTVMYSPGTAGPLQSRLPVYLQGRLPETLWSSLLALPIAAAVALFNALVASAPLLLLLYLLLLLLHRYRPELLRSHGSIVTALLFLCAASSYGLPPLSFAPRPENLLPPLVTALPLAALLMHLHARHSRRTLPSAEETATRIAGALVAVAASGAYRAVAEAFNSRGPLPLQLGV